MNFYRIKGSIIKAFLVSGLATGLICSCSLIEQKKPIAFTHRGYHENLPENTNESFQFAADKGFNALETDIVFSSEGIPIVFHDAAIMKSDGLYYPVCGMTYAEIKEQKIEGKYEIPSLDEFLGNFLNSFEWINLDIKVKEGFSADVFHPIIEKYGNFDKIIISSCEYSILQILKNRDPRYLIGTDGIDNRSIILEAIKNNYPYALAHYEYLTDPDIWLAEKANVRLVVYTVNSLQAYSGLSDNEIFGVITDHPQLFQ